jgi:IPT/TIG domain
MGRVQASRPRFPRRRFHGRWVVLAIAIAIAIGVGVAVGGGVLVTQGNLSSPGSDLSDTIGPSASSDQGTDPSSTQSSGGGAASETPGSSDSDESEQSSSTEDERNPVVAWILSLAPGGGVDYPEEAVYFDLLDDCLLHREDDAYYSALSVDEQALYQGAAAACRAAFYGESENWQAAEAGLAQVNARGAQFTCLGDATYDALRELVAVHAAEPTARIVKGEGTGRAPVCPRIISVDPAHGPASGGYPVELEGQNLPATAEIHFGDETLTVQTDGSRARVTVPPAPEEARSAGNNVVDVWVSGWYQDQNGQAFFEYELDAHPSGSSASEESPPEPPGEDTSPTVTPGSEADTTTPSAGAESPAGSGDE